MARTMRARPEVALRRGAALLALGACAGVGLPGAAATAAAAGAGISGRVLAGPTCPVESVPPAPACAPRPLRASLRIERAAGARPVATVRAAADGRFRVTLDPGTYVVVALRYGGSGLPRPPGPIRVRVRAGRYTAVTVTYDTGIR
jgi:hypothetical protein